MRQYMSFYAYDVPGRVRGMGMDIPWPTIGPAYTVHRASLHMGCSLAQALLTILHEEI